MVARDVLVNRWNFVHFQDGCIQACFVHRRFDRSVLVPAAPEPCCGDVLECRWADPAAVATILLSSDLKHLLVPRGQRFIKAAVEVLAIDTRGARLAITETAHEIGHRRVERQSCRGINVFLIQNSSSFSGALLDFTACSFRVELAAAAPQDFAWIDPKLPVTAVFYSGEQTFYSGECRILRQADADNRRSYVLEPLQQELQRYRKAEIRSQRQKLKPSPNLVFRHPLTRKRVNLNVVDLSGSGFAVEEEESGCVLLPGLILPDVTLQFANSFTLGCSVQVVFRRTLSPRDGQGRLRCGLALIDMPAQDHIQLLAILHQVKDCNSYLCNELDLEALWEFLFDTGFIYPAKYGRIHKNKALIKGTYEKLYTRSPEIARHFVYQDSGVILGHMAMIRFWQNSWLIHHHAARKSAQNKAGLVVLDQIGRLTHDTFRFRGLHMDYLVCYYRPQNRFPERIFGGFARFLNNPKECSVDPCAYLSCLPPAGDRDVLPEGWRLSPSIEEDLRAQEAFYENTSGGLMLKALDLAPGAWQQDDISQEFQRHGFTRERHVFSLAHHGRVKAVIVAQVSDLGLNLSDLTNGLHTVVIDGEGLSGGILLAALTLAGNAVGRTDVPALIYPLGYAEQAAIPFEKIYHLWSFHIYSAGQPYLKYLSRLTKYVKAAA